MPLSCDIYLIVGKGPLGHPQPIGVFVGQGKVNYPEAQHILTRSVHEDTIDEGLSLGFVLA